MSWANQYIGIPFVEAGRTRYGADCWGLVRIVLAEQFSIDTPCFAEQYANDFNRRYLVSIIYENIESGEWETVSQPQPGDLIVLRLQGYPIHFGIIVDDRYFLHTTRGMNAHLSEHRSSLWKARIVDVLRHKERMNGEATECRRRD